MTVGEALQQAKTRLQSSDTASLDVQVMLAEIMGVNRAYLLAYRDQQLSPNHQAQFESWVSQREAGEPIAYILGRKGFYDREFMVSPDVLIPRPETEHLLEIALEYANKNPNCMAVDVGTGSGALAVTFKAHVPNSTVYAVDVSEQALNIARKNADRYIAEIHFLQGNLLHPLVDQEIQVDLIMANLPYIPTDDLAELEVRKHEPMTALDGGADGLDFIRQLLNDVPKVCYPQAQILLEIGAEQGQSVKALAHKLLSPKLVRVIPDYAGHDRVVVIDL